MTEIVPFRIEVPEADLVDLRERLRRTRWPEAETVDDWSQGVPLAYLQDLCRHWTEAYDWRTSGARLNRLDHYRTMVDGLPIHFVHVRSPHPHALPLVMTHGWPGSIIEFEAVVGPLTDPTAYGGAAQDAFHLVLPSLPGFGFSGKPTAPGWGIARIADAWAELMARLDYPRFGASGGGRPVGGRLLGGAVDQAPDHRLLTGRLTGGARRLDRGEAPHLERL
jgi:hypothetical protein